MSPSSNWLALRKSLADGSSQPAKRRKVETVVEEPSETSIAAEELNPASERMHARSRDTAGSLRQMVHGQETYPRAHLLPGKYVALDCEMVGIAGDSSKKSLSLRDKGDESSLARVSVVNYYGAVQLDTFVRQRERVTDWRTAVSGVRDSDMLHAKSFAEVQQLVADLLKNRVLVGHAVHNDLKALLLSHPHNMTRDTQILAGRHGTLAKSHVPSSDANATTVKVTVNRRPALRNLVVQELGIDIQSGEHSSVTDARATMALYRLHRKIWDKGFTGLTRTTDPMERKNLSDCPETGEVSQSADQHHSRKRKRTSADHPALSSDIGGPPVLDDDVHATPEKTVRILKTNKTVSVGQKGISSGYSVVVRSRKSGIEVKRIASRTHGAGHSGKQKDKWWDKLRN